MKIEHLIKIASTAAYSSTTLTELRIADGGYQVRVAELRTGWKAALYRCTTGLRRPSWRIVEFCVGSTRAEALGCLRLKLEDRGAE